jgi:hypothetical protein
MTPSQVTRRDSSVFVRLGQHDLPAPEPVAVILTELTAAGSCAARSVSAAIRFAMA